jgi:hypothetical protein
VTIAVDDRKALEELDGRIRTLLPEDYQESFEDIQPVPMRSAGLKYDSEGRVAWDEIWGSFCDLALAGGPPHKGALLEPASQAQVDAEPERFAQVTDEICRGITMVTDLPARQSPVPGWVRVDCLSEVMAGWLLRAIVVENVAVRCEGRALDLPAGPRYRLEKEIKNVVTVIAKTCHYWMGHMPRAQKRAIADLFATMASESPLVAPAVPGDGLRREDLETASTSLGETIRQNTGLAPSSLRHAGWLGVECPDVRAAVWMMRALVVSNVLSRREGNVLFVPVNPLSDPDGIAVAAAVTRIHSLAAARGML